MSQLIVRNLSPKLVARLKRRAAEHGRSAEAEHRAILEQALGSDASLKAVLAEMPDLGDDADFVRPRSKKKRRVRL